jgi:hypothetical protein
MKKNVIIVVAILIATTSFTSCDSKKSDAQKMADFACKAEKIKDKVIKSNTEDRAKFEKEFTELSEEYKKIDKELKEKYKNKEAEFAKVEAEAKELFEKNCKSSK